MKKITIDVGVIDRPTRFDKNPRIDGLIKMLKLAPIEYENISEQEFRNLQILTEIERKRRNESL